MKKKLHKSMRYNARSQIYFDLHIVQQAAYTLQEPRIIEKNSYGKEKYM